MPRDRLRQKLYGRVSRASRANVPALTVLRARTFLKHFPTFSPVWYMLGIALTELARYEEAEEALAWAIEHRPPGGSLRPLYCAMGQRFETAGDPERAGSWYRRAIEAEPDNASGHIYLGAVLAWQGKFAEAEKSHRTATRCTDGRIDEAFLNLGLVLRAQERFAEAAARFEEALRRDPDYRVAQRALRDVVACFRERHA